MPLHHYHHSIFRTCVISKHLLPSHQKNDLFADVEFYCFFRIITTTTINRRCVRYRRYYRSGFSSVWQWDRVHSENNKDERVFSLLHCFLRTFLASNPDWQTARYVLCRYSSVGMMIRIRAGRNRVRFPAGTTDISLRRTKQSPIQCITGVVSWEGEGGKRPETEALTVHVDRVRK
jgi:hypothetical protein